MPKRVAGCPNRRRVKRRIGPACYIAVLAFLLTSSRVNLGGMHLDGAGLRRVRAS